VTWSLGTTQFGSELGTGTMSPVGYTFLNHTGVGAGWDVYNSLVTGLSVSLTAGNTYFLTLTNGNDSAGDQLAAWDMNNGSSNCFFEKTGVPATACQGAGGEAFTISTDTASSPEPGSGTLLGAGVIGLAAFLRRKLSR